jgi:hypothetical protein
MGLARAQMLVPEASDQWFLDHFRSAASRARGDYLGCLDRWWSVFPRDQLLILFQDDIASRPSTVLDTLAAHVGIDAMEFAALPETAIGEVVVPGLGDGVVSAMPPPLRPSLLQPLLDLYGRDIAKLERLTGRDLSAWRELPSTARHTGQRTTSDGGVTRAADAEG